MATVEPVFAKSPLTGVAEELTFAPIVLSVGIWPNSIYRAWNKTAPFIEAGLTDFRISNSHLRPPCSQKSSARERG